MTNAVAKQESQLPATQNAQAPTPTVLSSDITIPSLLLMQGQSEFVQDRKAQIGDIVRSNPLEKLGAVGEAPLQIIPLALTYTWAELEKVGTKFQFRKLYPRDASNDSLPWYFWRNAQGQDYDKAGMMGTTEWKRVKAINVYGLLPRDIDAYEASVKAAQESGDLPDLDKVVTPVAVSFRSTSYNAGKAVTTHMAKVAESAQSFPQIRHYFYSLDLKAYADKNDEGQFNVWEIGATNKLPAKYRPTAEKWAQLLSRANVKVDPTGDTE